MLAIFVLIVDRCAFQLVGRLECSYGSGALCGVHLLFRWSHPSHKAFLKLHVRFYLKSNYQGVFVIFIRILDWLSLNNFNIRLVALSWFCNLFYKESLDFPPMSRCNISTFQVSLLSIRIPRYFTVRVSGTRDTLRGQECFLVVLQMLWENWLRFLLFTLTLNFHVSRWDLKSLK